MNALARLIGLGRALHRRHSKRSPTKPCNRFVLGTDYQLGNANDMQPPEGEDTALKNLATNVATTGNEVIT
jgi:hypothetical protein